MQIYEMNLSELTPYKNNPRDIASAISSVAESIKRFGFRQPLVVDAKGVIVCGHTRYFAAQKLGMETVPCVRAVDLTEPQLKAYRLLDNKLHELSSWNPDALAKELASFEFDFKPFRVDFAQDAQDAVFTPDPLDDKSDALDDEEDDADDDLPHTYQLVVACRDEEEQDELYSRLRDEGYVVRTCNL